MDMIKDESSYFTQTCEVHTKNPTKKEGGGGLGRGWLPNAKKIRHIYMNFKDIQSMNEKFDITFFKKNGTCGLRFWTPL